MRVLLTSSWSGRQERPIFPLGLAHLASCLKKHQVICVDVNVVRDPWSELANAIRDFQPEVIGISLRNIDTTQAHDVFSYWLPFAKMVRWLSAQAPDIPVIVGGTGFSLFPEEIMRRLPEIELGVYLEGEESFPELLDNLDNPHLVRGIFHRQNGEVIFTGLRPPPNLDDLPLPQRDVWDLPSYLKEPSQLGVQTKRGCCFGCIYCTYPLLSGKRVRVRRPQAVVDEIESLVDRYGVRRIFFADAIFSFPSDHAKAICQEIIDRGLDIKWRGYWREKDLDTELASLAHRSGCDRFQFSPDGFSDASLEQLGKGMRLEEIKAAYSVLARIKDARFEIAFLFNYPGARWKDLLDLAALVLELKIKNRNFLFPHVTNIRIYPHTELHKLVTKEKYIRLDDDLLLPVFYDPFPLNMISVLIRGLYRSARMMGRLRREVGQRRIIGGGRWGLRWVRHYDRVKE